MAYSLCDKISSLKPYNPASGKYKCRLDANESFFSIDKEICIQIQNALPQIDFNRYPDPFCEKLCEKFAEFYNLSDKLVTVGNGSDELISIIMTAFLMCGDTVLTTKPDFSMYDFYAHLLQCNLVTVEKDADLSINIDTLIKTANDTNAKMIIFSNPCNPTSISIPSNELIRLINSVNALVVLDEAYMDFWNQSLLNKVCEFDNLIILKTASKAFGLAAVRLGFAVSNLIITNALKSAKSPYNVNSITQKIGEIVYSNKSYLMKMTDEIVLQRDYLYGRLKDLCRLKNSIFVYESHTNFILVKFISQTQSRQVYEYLKNNSILVRLIGPYLRITASNNKDTDMFLKVFQEALIKLEVI